MGKEQSANGQPAHRPTAVPKLNLGGLKAGPSAQSRQTPRGDTKSFNQLRGGQNGTPNSARRYTSTALSPINASRNQSKIPSAPGSQLSFPKSGSVEKSPRNFMRTQSTDSSGSMTARYSGERHAYGKRPSLVPTPHLQSFSASSHLTPHNYPSPSIQEAPP